MQPVGVLAIYIKTDIIMPDHDAKALIWLGNSRDRVRSFPIAARQRSGFELRAIQKGRDPSDWKPMPDVGLGVRELRIHNGVEFRLLYIAKFAEAVYVLHAFEKKTQRTDRDDIAVGKSRFRALIEMRKRNRK